MVFGHYAQSGLKIKKTFGRHGRFDQIVEKFGDLRREIAQIWKNMGYARNYLA